MPPKFRFSIVAPFVLVVLYFIYWTNNTPLKSGTHTIDVLKEANGAPDGKQQQHGGDAPLHFAPPVETRPPGEPAQGVKEPKPQPQPQAQPPPSSSSPARPGAASGVADSELGPQAQFEKEYDGLGLHESAGAIYGNTLTMLSGTGKHAGGHAAALTPTESWTPYSDTPPYMYNPYPGYNNESWSAGNLGTYVPCDGPEGAVRDVMVFSGHLAAFEDPLMGSYSALDIDSNVCFERETRLGAYGFQDQESTPSTATHGADNATDWSAVHWGLLQEECARKNSNRYSNFLSNSTISHSTNSSMVLNGTEQVRRSTIIDDEARRQYSHEIRDVAIKAKSRTAVLLRSCSGREFSENDKQNIRSLVTELCLRSGGEYQVYLLVQVKDKDIPMQTDQLAYQQAIGTNVPEEFRDMTVLWNDAIMRETYPKFPSNIHNLNQSQWLPVQKFAQDYPQFDYYWNWELESRYTGHHYNLLEKLAAFAQAQPRRGLWERNERYYIPSVHGPYDSGFRTKVEQISGTNTIWGPPTAANITSVGPTPPVMDPRDDDYVWGVGEEADYISLAPIFNPEKTNWTGTNDVWGYEGPGKTPRRATIGLQSRCSRKLLDTMHAENLRGNHVRSEMAPQTVALLHGLKAVFAPIPMFFDRPWPGKSLEKWFNPGPKGESGSVDQSPFSLGKEGRFAGVTWYDRAAPPIRLYNNWLGWEDGETGGPKWEATYGRTCLPPLLLHPITDVVKPPARNLSDSEQPSSATA